MAVAVWFDSVGTGSVGNTGIGVAVAIGVGVGESVGTVGVVAVGAAVFTGFGGGTWVSIGLASLVADIAARTVAAISGVGATAMGVVGIWVGSAEQEVATRARMARAGKTIARWNEAPVRDTESLRL